MAITVAPYFTQRTSTWSEWKSILTNKSGVHQYDDDGNIYTIWFYDTPDAHICNIWKNEVPQGVIDSGYTQEQNDLDKADFESNYKSTSNGSQNLKVIVNYEQEAIPIYITTSSEGINYNVFGEVVGNISLPTSIYKTSYTEVYSNFQGSISSTSTNDGYELTKARQVKITYFTQDGSGPYTETINLNGTSWVNSVNTNLCFIEKIEVVSVGTKYSSNAGVITLKNGLNGSGTTIGTIAVGDNRTFWAHHYISNNKTGEIKDTTCSGTKSNNGGAFFVKESFPLLSTSVETQITPTFRTELSASSNITFSAPPISNGFSKLIMYVVADNNNQTFYGSFTVYEK